MTRRQWSRAVKFANANLLEETVDLGSFLRLLGDVSRDDRATIPELQTTGLPAYGHPALIEEVRRVQPQVRLLLRFAAGKATKDEIKAARAVLQEHRDCPHDAIERMPWLGATEARQHVSFTYVTKVTPNADRRGSQLTETIYKAKAGTRDIPMRESQVRTSHLIDAVCMLVRESDRRRTPPVRVCQLTSCGRLFVRKGRRSHCSQKCKSKRWRMSREAMRDYAYRRMVRELSVKAIRARIAAEPRKKSPLEKRRRHLRVLRAVLRAKVLLRAQRMPSHSSL